VTIPATLITASVTEFPIITSDVTAISETKSEIIGTYDNSDGYPSNGSTSTVKDDFTMQSETTSKASNIAPETEDEIEDVKCMSKPRLALFQGREDDEPMAPQVNISASIDLSAPDDLSGNNMKDFSLIQFGAFSSDVRQYMKKELDLSCTPVISTKLFFMRINLLKKQERKLSIIQFGSMPATEIT
jgi:hypothetical protein